MTIMFYGNIVENDKMEPKRKHKDGPRSSEAFFFPGSFFRRRLTATVFQSAF